MRLIRRRGSLLEIHRRVSWWAAVGTVSLLLAGTAFVYTWQTLVSKYDLDTSKYVLGSRRLSDESDSAYPDDPFISKPYEDAPPSEKCAVIIHIIVIGYMLLGLNTVCDAFFCGALDTMVDQWKVEPDVAGATFMAAGGSAPELFTSLIGACITENDVGFGTIVGSAVFNVLAVIGACGIATERPLKLRWWPLFRDCTYYIVCLALLAAFAHGEIVTTVDGDKVGGGNIELWEAIVLFVCYLIYCIIMWQNKRIEKFVTALRRAKVSPTPGIGDGTADGDAEGPDLRSAGDGQGDEAPYPSEATISCDSDSTLPAQKIGSIHSRHHIEHHIRVVHHHIPVHRTASDNAKSSIPSLEEEENNGDDATGSVSTLESDDIEALLIKPQRVPDRIIWYLSLPIYAPLYYCIPKPSERCFLATFFISLLWIGGFSFFLVYCVEILGTVVLGGGRSATIILSFTLLAAGTSIPDLVSSMAVAHAGEGDMSVSSSIGSNIFDILVGLPIPWIIKILVIEGMVEGESGFKVRIQSPYIPLYVILLLFMVFCVVVSIHALGWFLNRQLGICMAVLYVVFLAVVLPVELIDNGPYI